MHEKIIDLFAPEPWPTGAQGISAETADAIDAILARTYGPEAPPHDPAIRVDRERLEESWEAWIYVVVVESLARALPDRETGDALLPNIRGLGTARGVLTWPNSD
jgi:hypothetical protein